MGISVSMNILSPLLLLLLLMMPLYGNAAKDVIPEDKTISATTLIVRQNVDSYNTESTFENTNVQSKIVSKELTSENKCTIPGYIWALLGLTSILAFLFIPLLVYAIRISQRYHKVCIKLESWKNQGESKLPPYLDMSKNTIRRPAPLQPHLVSDVNSLSSATTPPQTPLSTESAFSSHLFDSASGTLPRPAHMRQGSTSSSTYSPSKNADSTNGYSSLKRTNSTKSYTNPTMGKNPSSTANMPQFSVPPPPTLDEMEEEADHFKENVGNTNQNDIFVF